MLNYSVAELRLNKLHYDYRNHNRTTDLVCRSYVLYRWETTQTEKEKATDDRADL